MKKVFLFVVLSVFAFTSFSQVEEINGKKYIVPDAVFNGCVEFDCPDSLTVTSDKMFSYDFWFHGNHDYYNYFYDLSDFAQLFHTDDSTKVIGIAGYMNTHPYVFLMNNYLGIADTSFNILEEKVLSDTLMSNGNRFPYFELIFDNPVNVIGDFYVMTDFAKPSKYNKDGVLYEDTLNNKYNWAVNPIPQMMIGIDIPLIVNQKPCTKQVVVTHPVKYYGGPNKPDIEDFGWLDIYDTASYGLLNMYMDMSEYLAPIHGVYLFPLIGEDEEDTVSSDESVEVENYTYVFPNPASDKVTIQSSFKIQTIEMFNEQGQKVFVTQPNSYNSTINVSSYQKGTYIIKTATKSGSATKKIVVQ